MTILDWIKNILVHKSKWKTFSETDQKSFNPFIVNRWLSMDKDFIEIVNIFQKYCFGVIENRYIYKWYRDALPKGKRYNKYIKNKKQKSHKSWVVDIIKTHFEVSSLSAIEYIDIFKKTKDGKKQLSGILQMYGIGEDKIKSIVKK